MNRLFVTTFSKHGYELYGKRFLEHFRDLWPRSERLICFYEGERPDTEDDRITYLDLGKDRDRQNFLKKHAGNEKSNGIVVAPTGEKHKNYRFDAVRFSHKIFALTSPLIPVSDWRIWIDADVVTKGVIPEEWFRSHIAEGADCYYLGRSEAWDHSECGFMAFRMDTLGRRFLEDFRKVYTGGELFRLPQQHDSYVFDVLRKKYERTAHFENIAKDHDIFHPWPETWLGEYLEHLKGPVAKHEEPIGIDSIVEGCKDRYEQLTRLVAWYKPKTIVEVGTCLGERAAQICREALKHNETIHYTGFDLFEDATPANDALENNAKKGATLGVAQQALDNIKMRHSGFDYELVKGNTRTTLPAHKFAQPVDFVFLDGGHSLATVESDFNALKMQARVMVLDDYYIKGVDTARWGCNKLLEGVDHVLLPVQDTFGEMTVAMALVDPKLPKGKGKQELRMKTRNCAKDAEIQENIAYSARFAESGMEAEIKRLKKEVELYNALKTQQPVHFISRAYAPHGDRAILVSAGDAIRYADHPEYAETWEAIKRHSEAGDRVICNKTNHDMIIAHGIVPWACVLLDPRDHVASKFTPHTEVIYFISSMCHESTWQYMALHETKRIVGYHAAVGAGEAPIIKEKFGEHSIMVAGGTSSVMRAFHLFYLLGFRRFETYALDSSYWKKPDKPHGRSVKEIMNISVGGREFLTDGEMVAQSQDMEVVLKSLDNCEVIIHGDGLLQHAAKTLRELLPSLKGHKSLISGALTAYMMAMQSNKDDLEIIYLDSAVNALKDRQKHLSDRMVSMPNYTDLLA